MLGNLFKTSGAPMSNDKLGFTIACLLCSIMGVMGLMRVPIKSPPILAACALSACCSSSQTSSLVNDINKRVKRAKAQAEYEEQMKAGPSASSSED